MSDKLLGLVSVFWWFVLQWPYCRTPNLALSDVELVPRLVHTAP